MAAGVHNIALEQGSTFRLHLTWGTRGTDAQGNPIIEVPYDLTGCTARMQIRNRAGGTLLLELNTENGGIDLGGTDGTIDVLITDEQTDSLEVRRAKYDLEVYFPNGDTRRPVKGDVTVDQVVTRGT